MRTLGESFELESHPRRPFATSAAISNRGELAFAMNDQLVWLREEGEVRWDVDLTPLDLAFDAAGERLAVGTREGIVALYDREGTLLALVHDAGDRVPWVGFAPDGRLGAASWDGALRFYSPDVLGRSPEELVAAAERAWGLVLEEVLEPRQ
ncbi:MAG: hypothetical protein AAGH15_22065 [Myxococcota bacterium]